MHSSAQLKLKDSKKQEWKYNEFVPNNCNHETEDVQTFASDWPKLTWTTREVCYITLSKESAH